MKNVSLLISVIVLLFTPFVSNAQTDDMDRYNDRDPCGYSDGQLTIIETASDYLFEELAEERIIQKHFGSSVYIDLVRTLTDEFVLELETILDVCRDGQIEFYDRQQPMNMSDLAYQMHTYRDTIQALKEFSDQNIITNDTIHDGLGDLQGHLVGDVIKQMTNLDFIKQTSDMNLTFTFENVDAAVEGIFTMASVSEGRADGLVSESNLIIKTDLDVDTREEVMKFVGSVGIDVRVVDGHIYLKLNDSQMQINESSLDPNQRNERDKMKETLQLLEGKWIDVMDGVDIGNIPTDVSFLEYTTSMQDLFSTSFLMLYSEDNEYSYAGIDPRACASVAIFSSVRSCLYDMWMPSREETKGRGFIRIAESNGTYALGLTDTFSNEKFPSEMQSFVDKDLLTWDTKEILSLHLPLGDAGFILYNNGNIEGEIQIPGEDIATEIEGTAKNNTFAITAAFVGDDVRGSMTMSKSGPLDDVIIEANMNIEANGIDAFDLGFDLYLAADQQTTLPSHITAPDPDDVVDLSVFN